MSTIIAAVDFSPVTDEVLETARVIAKSEGASVLVLHVEAPDPDFIGFEPGPQTVRDTEARIIQAHHDKAQEYAESFRNEGIDAKALVIQGPTAEKILSEAERSGASFVVLGSHGHGALYHLLLGSVCEAVIKGSKSPIVVVPHKEK